MRTTLLVTALLVACGGHHGNGTDAPGDDDAPLGSDGTTGCDPNDPSCNGGTHSFATASLIIPMDLSYQATGMFQAYGLIYQLLKNNIRVYWMIDPNKTYHATDATTAGNPCAWDCGVEGSGVKCAYPTASPDFMATTKILWDDANSANNGTTLGTHGYRGGPFAIDAADHDAALAIINMWNTQGMIPRARCSTSSACTRRPRRSPATSVA